MSIKYIIPLSIILGLSAMFFASPLFASSNIVDGDLISAEDSFDVYIVKIIPSADSGQATKKFKRLILNPDIFNSYEHLKWENVKSVSESELNTYTLSELVLEVNPDGSVADPKVYKVSSAADSDTGERRWLDLTTEEFETLGYDWDAIYKINSTEASPDFYPEGVSITV